MEETLTVNLTLTEDKMLLKLWRHGALFILQQTKKNKLQRLLISTQCFKFALSYALDLGGYFCYSTSFPQYFSRSNNEPF